MIRAPSVSLVMSKRVFVTVGSTTFSELVTAVLSSETIKSLERLGFNEIVLQYGADKQLYAECTKMLSCAISIEAFDYSPSIQKEIERADLIISHAGLYHKHLC